ncbi:MAG TPA: hypothetical protein VGM41_19610 [Chitinophagaceae bacterium]|jgi:hypothetical protein
MLQAKELRFGNKVQTLQGEVITIQQILCSSVIYDTLVKVNRETVNSRGSFKTTYTTQVIEMIKEADFQDINPIVLTPKVLEKCGLRNFIRDEWILSVGKIHIDFEFSEDGLKLRPPYPCRISMQYVHQLQNLLFSITGHELEVDM